MQRDDRDRLRGRPRICWSNNIMADWHIGDQPDQRNARQRWTGHHCLMRASIRRKATTANNMTMKSVTNDERTDGITVPYQSVVQQT